MSSKSVAINNQINDNYSETSSVDSKKSKNSWSKFKSTLTHTVGSKSKFRKSNDINDNQSDISDYSVHSRNDNDEKYAAKVPSDWAVASRDNGSIKKASPGVDIPTPTARDNRQGPLGGVNNPQKPPRPVSTKVTDKEISTYKKNPNNLDKMYKSKDDHFSETSSINSNESKKSKNSWSKFKSTLTHTVGSKSKFRKSNDINDNQSDISDYSAHSRNENDNDNNGDEKDMEEEKPPPGSIKAPRDKGSLEKAHTIYDSQGNKWYSENVVVKGPKEGVNDPQKPPRPVSTRVTDKEISTYKESPNNMNKSKDDHYSETSSINSNESKKSKNSWSKVKSTLSHTVGSKSKLRGYENNPKINDNHLDIPDTYDIDDEKIKEKGPYEKDTPAPAPAPAPIPRDDGPPRTGSLETNALDNWNKESSAKLKVVVNDPQKPPRPVSTRVTDKESSSQKGNMDKSYNDINKEELISNHGNDNYSETSSINSNESKKSKSSWSKVKSTLSHSVGSKSKLRAYENNPKINDNHLDIPDTYDIDDEKIKEKGPFGIKTPAPAPIPRDDGPPKTGSPEKNSSPKAKVGKAAASGEIRFAVYICIHIIFYACIYMCRYIETYLCKRNINVFMFICVNITYQD
jgi:hypothetical protein